MTTEALELSESRTSPRGLKSILLAILIASSGVTGVYAFNWFNHIKANYIANEIKAQLLETPIQIDSNEKRKRMGANLTRDDLERALFTATNENMALTSKLEMMRETLR